MEDVKNSTGSTEEEVVEETAAQAEETSTAGESGSKARSSASKTINEAIKQVETFTENISKALSNALQDRVNVVMVRVNDESLAYLDMLVEADVTRSRSESAAFLINEGIKANQELFNRIREITDQIAELKAQLRQAVRSE